MRERGFTLIELMVTLAVFGILVSLAAPSFRDMIESNKVISSVNELVSVVNLAKNEAVLRKSQVNIESLGGAGDWSGGIRVYVDVNSNGAFDAANEALIRQLPASTGGTTIFPTVPIALMSFGRTGLFVAGAGGAQVQMNFCSNILHFGHERQLTVSIAGRVTVVRPQAEIC